MTPTEITTLADSRPIAQALVLALSAFAIFGGAQALYRLRYPGRIAWRAALRLNGWLPTAVGALLLAGVLLLNDYDLRDQLRLVEIIVPLVLAVQAALAFSPDDEPALEVVLACPRPVGWLLLERLLILAAPQCCLALLGSAATAALTGEPLTGALLTRWIPPAILLITLACYATISGRLALFGMMFTLAIWGIFVFVGEAFLPGQPILPPLDRIQPYIWPFQPYITPERLPQADYALNRLGVVMLGAALLTLALRQLADTEKVLLGTRRA